jgi:hypothetical protein
MCYRLHGCTTCCAMYRCSQRTCMLLLLLSECRTLSKSTRSLEDSETKKSVAALDASCINTPKVTAFACSSLEIVLRSKQSVAGAKSCCEDAAALNRTARLETAAAAFSTLLVAMIFTQEKCSKESEAHPGLKQTHSKSSCSSCQILLLLQDRFKLNLSGAEQSSSSSSIPSLVRKTASEHGDFEAE